ncbi:MAG: HipA family kinase [Pseudomonadota bacterium]
MSLNNPRTEIATAYPDLSKDNSAHGKGVTLLGDISTDQGRIRAFVKLLSPEGIAREAICSVLAKMLHLPVRQGYYVDLGSTQFHRQAGNVEGLAFGCMRGFTPLFRLKDLPSFESDLLKWPELLRSAVFDEWIANGDRLPNNMAFERGNVFWLFDHDEAFPGHVGPNTPVCPQLLALVAKNKTELDLHRIRNQALAFVRGYESINWEEVSHCVRATEVKFLERYFVKQINFLKARIPEMQNILTQDLGIRQSDFFSSNPEKNAKNQNHEN